MKSLSQLYIFNNQKKLLFHLLQAGWPPRGHWHILLQKSIKEFKETHCAIDEGNT